MSESVIQKAVKTAAQEARLHTRGQGVPKPRAKPSRHHPQEHAAVISLAVSGTPSPGCDGSGGWYLKLVSAEFSALKSNP